MILLTSITLIMIIISIILYVKTSKDYGSDGDIFFGCAAIIFSVLFFLSLLLTIRWTWGEDVRTGYIYSVDEQFGKGSVHIRMGKDAGSDSQPTFCVSGDNLTKVKELAGSGIKVKVTIPQADFRLENDYFACTSEPIIETMEVDG